MKRLIFIFCMGSVLVSCSLAQADPNIKQVLDTVSLYLGQIDNRFSVFKADTAIGNRLSHNDAVPSEAQWKYDSIKESLRPLGPGGYVCTSISIVKTYKDHIWVDRMKTRSEKEDTYFVLLKYHIVAKYDAPKGAEQRQILILETPIEYERYIIIAKDDTDGFFKPIDVYPRVRGELDFYTIPTILEHPEVKISDGDRSRLCEIYLNFSRTP